MPTGRCAVGMTGIPRHVRLPSAGRRGPIRRLQSNTAGYGLALSILNRGPPGASRVPRSTQRTEVCRISSAEATLCVWSVCLSPPRTVGPESLAVRTTANEASVTPQNIETRKGRPSAQLSLPTNVSTVLEAPDPDRAMALPMEGRATQSMSITCRTRRHAAGRTSSCLRRYWPAVKDNDEANQHDAVPADNEIQKIRYVYEHPEDG